MRLSFEELFSKGVQEPNGCLGNALCCSKRFVYKTHGHIALFEIGLLFLLTKRSVYGAPICEHLGGILSFYFNALRVFNVQLGAEVLGIVAQ